MVEFVRIILRSQILRATFVVSSTTCMYVQKVGITTGLSCGTQLANLFLRGLDLYVQQALHSSILFYTRFIDDVLVIHSTSTDSILECLNDWDGSITITHEDDESAHSTSFLDLNVKIEPGCIEYCTYRKPTNTYAYLPYVSNHGQNTFDAIVYTELYRLLRTNRRAQDLSREVAFFRQKFLERGHSPAAFDRIADKFWFLRKAAFCAPKPAQAKRAIVPFKMSFFQGFSLMKLGKIINKHFSVVDESIAKAVRPVLCCTTSANLFRIRYDRFL